MRDGTREERLYISSKKFIYFAIYYFPEYFAYKMAGHHFDMVNDLDDLRDGKFKNLMWVMYRGSAKTTFAKMFEIYCICFKLRHYMCIDSYDKENADASTFDIAVELQTNRILIKDFGQLFNEVRTDDEKKQKKISSFITSNGIKVEAISTQESVRGKLYKKYRPDYVRLDDFETAKTVGSQATTKSVDKHISEFKSGLAANYWMIYLGNLISESGNVFAIMQNQGDNPDYRIRNVPVEDANGVIAWPDKFVHTNEEAATLNKDIEDVSLHKVSLQEVLKNLTPPVYAGNMMNSPEQAGDNEFDRAIIEDLMTKATEPKRKVAGWFYWSVYNASHRYAMGGDTAKGVGRDSNAGVLIDFSTTPCQQVASYANNMIPPDQFAHEMKNTGSDFGECLLIPEINNTGYATVTELKRIYPSDKIWHKRELTKTQTVLNKQFGWETTGANRYELITQLKKAVHDGLLKINDKRILEEMKRFCKSDVEDMGAHQMATRHFDLLMATALAWVGRDYAESSKTEEYQQPDYEPTSALETSGKPSKVTPYNINNFEQPAFDS